MRGRLTITLTLLLLLLAPLTMTATVLAAPVGRPPGAFTSATHGGNACRPNPSPPSSGATIEVRSPTAKEHLPSPIVATGRAIAFEAQFGITLYDQNGTALTTINARTAEGQVLSPFIAIVPYTVAAEQDGCLWLYNVSGRDGSPINIVQVPVRLYPRRAACFSEVGGVCIEERFLDYWLRNGGLYQFGFPLAPGFVERAANGQDYFVQYFERARFEAHPEQQPPYTILLGLLGNTVTANRRSEEPFRYRPRPAGCPAAAELCSVGPSTWFSATGHFLGEAAGGVAGAAIANQWSTKGGLAVYGYPLSEVLSERGYDGNTYQVQYFERHRLEYHPDLANTIYVVELGQLGRQVYDERYPRR